MNLKKKKGLMCLLFAGLLCLPGCGSKTTTVTDYGNKGNIDEESADNNTDDSEGEQDFVQESAGMKLSDMLGGQQLEFEKKFNIGSKNASINVIYNVNETDKLSVYNVSSITEQNVKEEEIVKNILGDSAEALNTETREYLNENKGDSRYIIYCCQYVSYHNGGNFSLTSHKSWVDEDMYYIHCYEGQHNGLTYQLMVSYSKQYKELVVTYYPKNCGDIVGDETLDKCDSSSPDGCLYLYNKGLKQLKLSDEMADSPNRCTLSDEELTNAVTDTLKNDIYVDFPEEAITFYENLNDIVMPENTDYVKSELVFLNSDIEQSGNLSGAKRDGYTAYVMHSLCNQRVMADTEIIDDSANDLQTGAVEVNNSGVIGLMLSSKYIFEGTVTDNVNVLTFDKAMEAAVSDIETNISVDNLEKADDSIVFDQIDLVYFPVPSAESTSKYTLVPAWSLEAENQKKQTVVRVLINATDGSYITSLYE